MPIETQEDLRFLSELYVADTSDVCLLCEYPSSNSDETVFQNKTEYIIHDPFPPPPRELLTSLGPHHLMYCWGNHVPVTSQIAPPQALIEHWRRTFGSDGTPNWTQYDENRKFITLFPHESIPASQQVVDPKTNYELHSKEVIEKIDCPQAEVFDSVRFPCIVKLSHGYAGLGNFLLKSDADEKAMREELAAHWPDATLVINSVIEEIAEDYGVQFYLRSDGRIVWIGLTEQHFNESNRWCGGTYSADLQTSLIEPFESIVEATAEHLHEHGYFGLVGIDILRNSAGESFLVDVNPRLTGITPFLMASRIFDKERSFGEGIYRASFRFSGSLASLIERAESFDNCKVMILSAHQKTVDDGPQTVCHISVSSESRSRNLDVLQQLEAN